jgi:hypothetical protein
MKKILLALLIAIGSSFAFTACTEEQITPADNRTHSNGGGGETGNL